MSTERWNPKQFNAEKLYPRVKHHMEKLREGLQDEVFHRYTELLSGYLCEKASLASLDNFVAAELATAELRDEHSKLFLVMLDGCQLAPAGGSSSNCRSTLPHVSQIAARLMLRAAVAGVKAVEGGAETAAAEAVMWHVHCLIEDAVRVRLPYSINSAGSLKIATSRSQHASAVRVLTARDIRDGIEMFSGEQETDLQKELKRKLLDKLAKHT